MTYEVSAAAKLPQTTPPYIDIRVDTREGNGEHRRRRDSGRCAQTDRQNGTNDSRNGEAAQRRGGGDTLPGVVCGGFAAADTSYVIVRASFAPIHHSKQPFSLYWRPKSWALAREAYSGIGLL